MKKHRLEHFTRGWLVGDFDPSIIRTPDFEFMVRSYAQGEKEARHVHKIAHEITVIVSGKFRMAGGVVEAGDVIHLEPGDSSDFECLEPGFIAVTKAPSAIGDKYPA